MSAPKRGDELHPPADCWYAIDDAESIIWLTRVATGHPKETERRNRHGRR